jgi:hypothetical protein
MLRRAPHFTTASLGLRREQPAKPPVYGQRHACPLVRAP